MSELQTFTHAEFGQVRTLLIENLPYFVGKDVATLLGYKKHFNALERHVEIDDTLKQGVVDSNGKKQITILINESGLYSLILSSKLPKAKEFKKWVTRDVLPSIRKHSIYARADLLEDPELLIEALQRLKAEKERNKALEKSLKEKEKALEFSQPRLNYLDNVLASEKTIAVTHIAKDYGLGAASFNHILHQMGIQYKLKDCWVLKFPYATKGYAKTRTYKIGKNVITNLEWTQKGRMFLYDFLKAQGIVPLLEKLKECGEQ